MLCVADCAVMVVSGVASCVTVLVVTLTKGNPYPNDAPPLALKLALGLTIASKSSTTTIFYVVTQHLDEKMGQQAC